jgi:4,5-dihydroxyphthalate decarboxylase
MKLKVALSRYDRHIPLFNGDVAPPDGIEFDIEEIGESQPLRGGSDRHKRILNGEFDIGEMSFSSFIAAVGHNPDLDLVGVPVFPRRFFSVGQIYVNVDAGIEKPTDLIGRKVGLHSFQTTLSVLAKGDMKLEYGVAWEDIEWLCIRPEIVPVDLGDDVKVGLVPDDKNIGDMLCDGEISALFSPHPPPAMLKRPDRWRRLFRDTRAEEARYFRKYGFCPIMHILVMKTALAESYPALPKQLVALFDEAKRIAYDYYYDSNYSLLLWSRYLFEEQRDRLSDDPWPNGFKANRKNVEQFIGYSADQRLIPAAYPAERLFHPSVLDS